MSLTCRPVTPSTMDDLVELFGPNGASGGCWCMFWRLTRREWEANGNAGNRAALCELVDRGTAPGLLAYRDNAPVGWCSVAPRTDFGPLERSRKYPRLDDAPVWSVTCLYLKRPLRHQGIAAVLLDEAVRFAARNGARIVEGYPSTRGSEASYMGTVALFTGAGFRYAGGDPDRAPVYRRELTPGSPRAGAHVAARSTAGGSAGSR